jgi:hypothetical protein
LEGHNDEEGEDDAKPILIPTAHIPAKNMTSEDRPNSYACPNCEIVYFGTRAIILHMLFRHQEVFEAHTDTKGGVEIVTPKQ